MTTDQLKALITTIYAQVGAGDISRAELDALMKAIVDFINQQDAAVQAQIAGSGPNVYYPGGADVVATAPVLLNGLQDFNGETGAPDDVVLVTANTTLSQNGPWLMKSGAWVRPTGWSLTNGMLVSVRATHTAYQVSFTGSFVAGTTALNWRYAFPLAPTIQVLDREDLAATGKDYTTATEGQVLFDLSISNFLPAGAEVVEVSRPNLAGGSPLPEKGVGWVYTAATRQVGLLDTAPGYSPMGAQERITFTYYVPGAPTLELPRPAPAFGASSLGEFEWEQNPMNPSEGRFFKIIGGKKRIIQTFSEDLT